MEILLNKVGVNFFSFLFSIFIILRGTSWKLGIIFYAPNFEKVGDILVSACAYVCVYSCSRYRLETSCMDSSWKNSQRLFLVFPELSPLVKLRPFDKQGDEIL